MRQHFKKYALGCKECKATVVEAASKIGRKKYSEMGVSHGSVSTMIWCNKGLDTQDRNGNIGLYYLKSKRGLYIAQNMMKDRKTNESVCSSIEKIDLTNFNCSHACTVSEVEPSCLSSIFLWILVRTL